MSLSLVLATGIEFSRVVAFANDHRVMVAAIALAVGVAVVSARVQRRRSDDGYEVPTEEELLEMVDEREE